MSQPNGLIVQITNGFGSDFTVNGTTILKNQSQTYLLELPFIEIAAANSVQVTLSNQPGQAPSLPAPQQGMCLCMIPGTSISLILTQSVSITIQEGYPMPNEGEGVGCGEGGF